MKESQTPPRTPLNDDEQERRANRAAMVQNRRQMKKTLLSPAVTTPKANPPSMATPKYSPLTPSAIRPEVATKPVAAQKLTMEQRNKMFEEWMKIAADNKINAKNSWNVALIDYFSELTFLRDGDSINFQKASCTLDGCVKIYATRVDSVADETGKLLNGLAEGGKSKRSLDFLAEPTENDDPKKLKLTSKRPHRAVDTLEKSFEALDLKNFEMEFAVDPLFKKMCAEFDESGTRGFLTCSLSLDDRGQLMFDSSESTKLTELRNLEEMNEENMVDTSQLMLTHGKALADIGRRTVLPSLGEFSFGLPSGDGKMTNAMTKLTTMTMNAIMDVDSDDDHPDGIHEELEEVIPLNDDYDEMPMPVAESESREQRPRGKFTEEVDSDEYGFSTTTTSSFLAYFDSKIQRNWAGPEHWKIQRPHLARSSPSSLISAKPKALKKEFTLDFNTDPVDISAIFVKANPVSITLSKSSLDERSTRDNLLPDDLHFSSSELLKLFIKPSWTVPKGLSLFKLSRLEGGGSPWRGRRLSMTDLT